MLKHLGTTSLVAKGSVTGHAYLFGAETTLAVDERDIPALLATGQFQKA